MIFIQCKVCKSLLQAAYYKCKKTQSSVLHLKSVHVVINGLNFPFAYIDINLD